MTMASSRIDRFFCAYAVCGHGHLSGGLHVEEWELYTNMAVYWPYLHAYLGVPV